MSREIKSNVLLSGGLIVLLVFLFTGISWATEGEGGYMDSYTGADAEKVGTDTCLMCHADSAAGEEATHVAIFDDEENENFGFGCETCHGPGGNHMGVAVGILQPAKMPQEDVTALCSSCHAEKGNFNVETWDGSAHQEAGNTCVTCHSGHSGNSDFLKEADVIDLCAECHSDKADAMAEGTHGPPAGVEMVCSDCHNPHAL